MGSTCSHFAACHPLSFFLPPFLSLFSCPHWLKAIIRNGESCHVSCERSQKVNWVTKMPFSFFLEFILNTRLGGISGWEPLMKIIAIRKRRKHFTKVDRGFTKVHDFINLLIFFETHPWGWKGGKKLKFERIMRKETHLCWVKGLAKGVIKFLPETFPSQRLDIHIQIYISCDRWSDCTEMELLLYSNCKHILLSAD